MKRVVLLLIRAYQKTLSPDHGVLRYTNGFRGCKFYPSCSQYMYESVVVQGVFKGVFAGIKRIVRCHPWSDGGHDPANKH